MFSLIFHSSFMEQDQDQLHHHLITLFDTLWFYHSILLHNPPPPPPAPEPELIIPIKVVQRIPNSRRSSHRRSISDEQLHVPSYSSTTQNSHQKLQTILSGKERVVQENTNSIEIKMTNKCKRRNRRRGISSTKSLSDLEFEELKGFMDLGFTFSDAETDPRLMSIVPGLRRRVIGCDDDQEKCMVFFDNETHERDEDEGGGGGGGGGGVVRPYLSEAWEVEEERRLRNWRIPAPVEGVDMKDCLRLWAQAVASTVR